MEEFQDIFIQDEEIQEEQEYSNENLLEFPDEDAQETDWGFKHGQF